MVRLRYTLNDPQPIDPDAHMVVFLPWADVPVTGGYAEVDDPETVEALRWRGFEIVQAKASKRVQKQQ